MKENTSGLVYLFKNRKLFLIAIVVGGMLGAVVSLFIPQKFLSTAIVYPYNTHTRENIVDNPQFGYEVETEQLMQLLESKTMRDRTIQKFHLEEYYEMDTTQQGWRTELDQKYIKDVTFFRSKYLSVVINVTTEKPELSADIANFQIEEVNNYREDIFKENRYKEFNNLEQEFNESTKRKKELADTIYAIKGGDQQILYNFLSNLDNLNYDASSFVSDPRLEEWIDAYIYENDRYMSLRAKYEKTKQILNVSLPSVYSIDRAVPSYKKVSPSLVLNTVIGAVVFLILVIAIRLMLDKYHQLKKFSIEE